MILLWCELSHTSCNPDQQGIHNEVGNFSYSRLQSINCRAGHRCKIIQTIGRSTVYSLFLFLIDFVSVTADVATMLFRLQCLRFWSILHSFLPATIPRTLLNPLHFARLTNELLFWLHFMKARRGFEPKKQGFPEKWWEEYYLRSWSNFPMCFVAIMCWTKVSLSSMARQCSFSLSYGWVYICPSEPLCKQSLGTIQRVHHPLALAQRSPWIFFPQFLPSVAAPCHIPCCSRRSEDPQDWLFTGLQQEDVRTAQSQEWSSTEGTRPDLIITQGATLTPR